VIWAVIKAVVSGILIAAVSEASRRNAAAGAILASLPLVSVMGMIWLWRDTGDTVRLADHAEATFWFVLSSLPMFLLIPALLRRDVGFWAALGLGCLLTIVLYGLVVFTAPRLGIRLPF
jgi:F0F1-type ATP synthase assembly protein I|tara:strand:+ start:335 stop:691 length:357 start_codon:yes stop_codon:yes gene_type:complete